MINSRLNLFSNRLQLKRGMVFGLLIVTALFAFEIFNYSTTDFALSDLLGELKFLGVRWATILSIAFCGIDFAGIARLFTPEQGVDEPAEVWYLFGAWMIAAVMNAMLTWWGVSIAILNHDTLGNAVVARKTLLNVVPIFVAIMVWLIRVLIIGTISMSGDRLFSQGIVRVSRQRNTSSQRRSTKPSTEPSHRKTIRPLNNRTVPIRRGSNVSSFSPYPKSETGYENETDIDRIEPTYTPVSFSNNKGSNSRQMRF